MTNDPTPDVTYTMLPKLSFGSYCHGAERAARRRTKRNAPERQWWAIAHIKSLPFRARIAQRFDMARAAAVVRFKLGGRRG